MFNSLKLIQKKLELQLALAGNIGNYADSFRSCYGCEGNCSGSCEGLCAVGCGGGCTDTCDGYCNNTCDNQTSNTL